MLLCETVSKAKTNTDDNDFINQHRFQIDYLLLDSLFFRKKLLNPRYLCAFEKASSKRSDVEGGISSFIKT